MEMRIEIQTTAEGMLHHHNQHPNTISGFHPLLYHRGSERRHIMEQMAVLLKDWPENIWHSEHDACIWDVGESGPLRSEEHTSELQSLRHLVCRLLLEKKK